MSSLVFAAVISSAFFQATWNFFAKKSTANKSALILVGWLFFGLITVPITAFFTDFSKFTTASIFYICLSGFIHSIYVMLLGWAYTVGDISVVYPISRGLGIALTTVFAIFLGFDEVSPQGLMGIVTVIFGIFLIGMREIPNRQKIKGFLAAILVALAVSSYSLADSRGAHHVPPLFFIAIMNLSTVLFASPILLTKLRKPALEIIKFRKREAFLVASGGSIAYLIILWAFTQTATSYVVALREFSVVIASMFGLFFLKEELYKRKILALIFIFAGIVLIKMA